jgi:hypothetical protein
VNLARDFNGALVGGAPVGGDVLHGRVGLSFGF